MVGILVSFWDDPFSGAILVSGRVRLSTTTTTARSIQPAEIGFPSTHFSLPEDWRPGHCKAWEIKDSTSQSTKFLDHDRWDGERCKSTVNPPDSKSTSEAWSIPLYLATRSSNRSKEDHRKFMEISKQNLFGLKCHITLLLHFSDAFLGLEVWKIPML